MTGSFPDDAYPPAASPPSAKPAGLWEDFVDIFVSPSEVFERRRASGFLVPLLVFVVLSVVIAIIGRSVMEPIMDAEFSRGIAAAMRKNPQLTQAQMDGPRAFMGKLAPVMVGFGALIMPMVVGVLLWLAGKLVQAKEGVGAACMIATYAFFPRILDALLRVVQAFTMDPANLNGQYRVSLSAARFLDPDTASPVLVALLGRIDLFTIWVTVLLAIGLAVVARIPRSRAAIAAAVVWIVGSLPVLLSALRAS
ncbi:MAG: YIP1 family protein [Gemmatimonadaceae bacterium]